MASFYVATDALIERNGKYLMIQETKERACGTWNLSGGGVEHGENPVEAVKREVYEETGLQVKNVEGLLGVMNSRSTLDNHPVIVFVFSCTVEDGDPDPEFDEEVMNAKYVKEDEIDDLELRNDVIQRAIKLKNQEDFIPAENFSRYIHPYLDKEPSD